MITSNIDVDDGLVNGAIGTLQYIEHLAEKDVTEETDTDGYGKITQTVRLWLTFDSKRVGTKARLKAKPYMTCKRDVLRSDWTPIRQQSVRIGLGRGKLIKCRRPSFTEEENLTSQRPCCVNSKMPLTKIMWGPG